jgi:tetrahydromethanopterin S-methyltransferase subunit G
MVISQELKKILALLKIITLKHIHEDLDEVHKKVEKTSGKIDKLLYVLIAVY